jgi:hypothetical protein
MTDATASTKDDFVARGWHPLLKEQGLLSFETLWNSELQTLDEANTNRGGISTVGRLRVVRPDGDVTLIVKRQLNHNSRTLRHPVAGVPTFQKEFDNIFRYKRRGIPTLTPVYFARRKEGGNHRAILVNEYLAGYRPLDLVVSRGDTSRRRARKRAIIRAAARFTRRLHDRGMVHNCLYPKHIFVAETDAGIDLRIIDLEKSRPFLLRSGGIVKDLDTLYRRSYGWSRMDFLRFLLAYQGVQRPTLRTRRLMGRILKRTRRKQER